MSTTRFSTTIGSAPISTRAWNRLSASINAIGTGPFLQHWAKSCPMWTIWERWRNSASDWLTTVFVQQGHYAAQCPNTLIGWSPALEIERIGDLLDHDPAYFIAASPLGVAATSQERT